MQFTNIEIGIQIFILSLTVDLTNQLFQPSKNVYLIYSQTNCV